MIMERIYYCNGALKELYKRKGTELNKKKDEKVNGIFPLLVIFFWGRWREVYGKFRARGEVR